MSTKAMNIKIEDEKIQEIKKIANVFHMTITDVINGALDDYLPKLKQDPFYRLTAMVEDASDAETEELLNEIESLTDDDLSIVSGETLTL